MLSDAYTETSIYPFRIHLSIYVAPEQILFILWPTSINVPYSSFLLGPPTENDESRSHRNIQLTIDVYRYLTKHTLPNSTDLSHY
jgi:hypothetical protein